jgi:hypothetical protein
MKWILVLILVNNHPMHGIVEQARFDSMNECFDAREKLVEKTGKPIINYQAVCVPYSKERLFREGRPSFK